MEKVEIRTKKPGILSHGGSGLKALGKRRNIIIYWVYRFCKTMSYFFSKNGGTSTKYRRNSNKNSELHVPLPPWDKRGTRWDKITPHAALASRMLALQSRFCNRRKIS